jgi:hypothetical protein
MDCDDLFEEDVEEVIDDEDVEGNNYMNANDVSEEDTGVDIEDDENSEGSKPVRDDSAYIFSLHKGETVIMLC